MNPKKEITIKVDPLIYERYKSCLLGGRPACDLVRHMRKTIERVEKLTIGNQTNVASNGLQECEEENVEIERSPSIQELREIIKQALADNEWMHLARLGLEIKKSIPDFEIKKYGYKKLSEMLKENSEYELKYIGLDCYVRRVQ